MQGNDIQALSGIECACQILAEAMYEGALVMTGKGTISYCNHSFAKMLALPASQVQGQSISKFLADPDNERLQQILLHPPHAAQIEIILKSCDSRIIPAQFSIVEHKCGSQISSFVIVKELSDVPNADVALEERTMQLAEAIKVLEIFSKMVFHDLRSPLRHIKSYSELLSEHLQGTVDDQSKQYLDVIAGAVTEINLIINNLLYYYKKTVL